MQTHGDAEDNAAVEDKNRLKVKVKHPNIHHCKQKDTKSNIPWTHVILHLIDLFTILSCKQASLQVHLTHTLMCHCAAVVTSAISFPS